MNNGNITYFESVAVIDFGSIDNYISKNCIIENYFLFLLSQSFEK